MALVRNWGWIGILAVGVCGALPFYRAPNKTVATLPASAEENAYPVVVNKIPPQSFPRVDVERA